MRTPSVEKIRIAKKGSACFSTRQELLDNPELGTELFPNVRKARIAITAKGKGKRGGGRIITYRVDKQTDDSCEITLLTIYDKSEIQSVSNDFIKYLLSQL